MYTVFLIDDEPFILNEIRNTIPWMDNGFEVIGVESDPFIAIERIKKEKPDVVFSDLKMPGMDGHAVMKEVRELKLEPEFVMLSAYGTFGDAKTFFQQDGFDYILKPVQIEEVQLVLEKLAKRLAKKYPIEIPSGILNPAFLQMLEYIQAHFKEKLSLEVLGHQFGLSPGYICNLFAKNMNTTLTCYITNIRMKKAVVLMEEGNLSFKCIALECGYSDYYYFSKVFKDTYGSAPRQYILER